MSILKQAEGGVPVTEVCLEHGMSNASFYKWLSKFAGMRCTSDYALVSNTYVFLPQKFPLNRLTNPISAKRGCVFAPIKMLEYMVLVERSQPIYCWMGRLLI